MSTKNVSIDEIKELVEWLNVSQDIQEFSLKYGDLEVALSRNADSGSAMAQPSPAATPQPQATPAPAPSAPKDSAPAAETPVAETPATIEAGEGEVLIKAPMVGTFYSSPKPGAPAFVEEGQAVEPESVLCIIEVMKLMSNIEAKVKGTVKKIYVDDQQPVEYGQPLMLIKKA
ncbi:acetyl-CoA carboxylase biotin carboxyl carrier protein [Chromohalobacter sp. HP20-39]|uniref:acetyl-CoA carboxylase biotin carboxyl carrier protein n=1 Tax=Chromohalobacter sp. HP20-39 TaxID=3079306 RepID=UPI00294AC4D5|nr:acetyl-CoA carboxylase biotin carboxyl carrier protein [Chromohalobacter sp. HP20-39]MDV6318171.1 acetyl-CoA carboxylase biotin carboxyl carrier protein [Chromohalobacter sp. HP20-39]